MQSMTTSSYKSLYNNRYRPVYLALPKYILYNQDGDKCAKNILKILGREILDKIDQLWTKTAEKDIYQVFLIVLLYVEKKYFAVICLFVM